jgi:hypothetical protein
MGDEPICTAATPKPVRELEAEAMQAYRAKYPGGALWHELDSSTRCMWVAYTEQQRTRTAALGKER